MIKKANYLRLGVNIDHVATVRNARGGNNPDPLRAALIAQKSGADGITAHLREDRRHISDADILLLKENIDLPLNFEMAATQEMLDIALKLQPNAACIVPEKRTEVTTEGGLDIIKIKSKLAIYIQKLQTRNIKVSLFLEPDLKIIKLAKELGVDIIEFHTGKYANKEGKEQEIELSKIIKAVNYAHKLGIECHAGHGLDYENVVNIAKITELKELNIGHFLIGESLFIGLDQAIKKMQQIIAHIRAEI
jgi:pyridoxine 5-phosphate synthase